MLSPSDFNNAVPQFTNGTYASNPINPQYVNEPTSTEYNQGVEPLQTLPAQWWNWFINKFTGRFNKINTYVKNIFNELTELLSLGNITPDGTESTPTTCQLKDMFASCYPDYVKCCTTGTACGCIPVIGTDLGTTNNNILVTDASGHLKPSGITVGTAAGCDASCFLTAGSAVCRATLLTSDIIDPQTGLVCGYHSVSLCADPSPDYPGMCELYLCGNCHTCSCPEGLQEEVFVDNAYYSCASCLSNTSCLSLHSCDTHLIAPSLCGACAPLCLFCKGRTGCCFCVWICAKEDIFLYQRPNNQPTDCRCSVLAGCGPYFINKGQWLYWCCQVSSYCSGCFDCWFCIQHNSTSYPGEEAFLKCFYSQNGNISSNGYQKINKGMWTVIPVCDYYN